MEEKRQRLHFIRLFDFYLYNGEGENSNEIQRRQLDDTTRI